MDRRHSQRVSVNINSRVIADNKTYTGLIDNISEDGMEYLMTSYVQASMDFAHEQRVEVNFQAPSGETVHFKCDIKWFMESAIDERVLIVGMKIIDPSPGCKKLI